MTNKFSHSVSGVYKPVLDKEYQQLAKNGALWEDSLDVALHNICDKLSHILKVELVSIWLLEGQSNLSLQHYNNPSLISFSNLERSKVNLPDYFNALCQNRIIDALDAYHDYRSHELSSSYLEQLNIKSILHATLRKMGQLSGVICLEHTASQRIWNEHEKAFVVSIADLISQRLTYEDARNNERYFRRLSSFQQATFDGANYSIITTDSDGIILSFNQAASQMLGYDKDEVVGIHTLAIIHDPIEVVARAQTLSQEIGQTIEPGFEVFVAKSRQGIAEEREWTYIRKDGSRLPVLLSVTALHDNLGEICGFLGIAIDISDRVLMQRALREEEARYHYLFEGVGDSIFVMKGDMFIDCNPATLTLFDCTKEQIINQPPYRFSPEFQPDGRLSKDKALEKINAAFAGKTQCFEWQHLRYNGSPFDAEVTLNAIEIEGEAHLLATVRDISERKQAEQALKQSKSMLEAKNESLRLINELSSRLHGSLSVETILDETLNSLLNLKDTPHVAIYLLDKLNKNLKLVKSYGFNEETLKAGQFIPLSGSLSGLALEQGKNIICSDFTSDERLETHIKQALLRSDINSGGSIPLIYHNQPLGSLNLVYKNNRVFSDTELETFAAIGKNLSLALANAQHMTELEYMAHHDSLTGLSNRILLHDAFQTGINKQPEQSIALLLLDLDRFKEINDTLGHHVGDKLLKLIGPRIHSCTQNYQTVISRLGGDEFTLLIYDLSNTYEIKQLAHNILENLRQPFHIDSMALEINASIGIAVYPDNGKNSHDLLRSADVAMYQAKNKGGGISLYNQSSDIHTPERLLLMAEMMSAISKGQLLLHYQPKLDLASNEIIGYEALVRWDHSDMGLLYPDKFMPLAEVSESIHYMTENVLQMALSQQQQWLRAGYNYSVAVNLSARNLVDDRCIAKIKSFLQQYETPPGLLELEITETALMQDPEGAIELLNQISQLGVKLSIDDFGTGYSSLAYLKQLPINTLKIDRVFVKDMLINEQDKIIVRSTIGLAHNLNLKVIAEGVEDQKTMLSLENMACDMIQGYHISKPKAWHDIKNML